MTTATIEWIATVDSLPDDDITVLVADASGEVYFGFVDAGRWRDASAMPMRYQPAWWAHMPGAPKL